MDSQMKNRMKRRETKKCNRFRARDKPDRIDLFKKVKASFDARGRSPSIPNDGSLVDKVFELIRERNVENVELVKTALDRLWRKTMNGEIQTGKDFEAISAAQDFLREVQSKTS